MSSSALNRDSGDTEKPLPPPPHVPTASESPVHAMSSQLPESPSIGKRPSITSANSFLRPKKKMFWRGKPCIIALPLEVGKDENGNQKQYWTPDEALARVQNWENQGYDTSGFNLGMAHAVNAFQGGRSREIYPDPAESLSEFNDRRFRVSIPDRRAWEDYVRELQEAKLRALGVRSHEETPSLVASPAPSPEMSRQTSSQRSIANQSANGFRSPLDARLSPPIGGANSFSHSSGMVSPGSQPGAPGLAFSRQSMAMPMNQFLGNEPHFPPSVSPFSGAFQQQVVGSKPASRGISPLLDSRSQSRKATRSPVSPMLEPTADDLFPGSATHVPQRFQQNSLAQSYHALRPPQLDRDPARYRNQAHIASPLPQGHRHNVSDALQREIDDAESHLEKTMLRELEEENAAHRSARKMPEHHEDQVRKEAADLIDLTTDAKPSSAERESGQSPTVSPQQYGGANGAAVKPVSEMARKTSGFVYDPTKNFTPSFGPGMFTFGQSSQPTPPESHGPIPHSHTTSNNSAFSTPLNVAAPSFTPGKPLPAQLPAQTLRREFSFTSALPKLKPDAPAFVPGSGLGITSHSGSQASQDDPVIFQNFNFNDIAVQAKKSKAVPILAPKPQDSDSEEGPVEDADGRIGPPTDRSKRTRRVSGDQVPLFASPNPEIHHPGSPPTLRKLTPGNDGSRDEITSPQEATGQLKDMLDAASTASGPSSVYDDDRIRKSSANASEYETHSKTSSIKSGADIYSPRSHKPANEPINGGAVHPAQLTVQDSPLVKSTLSATAKPFEFNPAAGSFSPVSGQGDKAESSPVAVPPPKRPIFSTGTGASRFAPAPKQPSRSPSPDETGEPADERSLESRILSGVSYVEPTYQEIDDVMRHFGEDSDIGIERNPAEAWRRSPPPPQRSRSGSRSLEERSPIRHQPQLSDRLATTASPNRLNQPFQYLPNQELGSSYDAVAQIVAENARYSPSYKEPRSPSPKRDTPVHQVSNKERGSISDWGSAISSSDEDRIHSRRGFFDARVHDVVGGVIDKRLKPLEESLFSVSAALTKLTSRSRSRRLRRAESADVENSDADDEEESTPSRPASPIKDRKFEKLKQILLEAIATQQTHHIQQALASESDLAGLKEAFEKLNTSIAERPKDTTPTQLAFPNELKELQSTFVELKTAMVERAAASEHPAVPVELKEMQATFEELKNAMVQRADAPPPVSEEFKQIQASLRDFKEAMADTQDSSAVTEELVELRGELSALRDNVANRHDRSDPQANSELEDVRTSLLELKSLVAGRVGSEAPTDNSSELKELHAALADLKTTMAERSAVPGAPSPVSDELKEMHASLAEIKVALARQTERVDSASPEANNYSQLLDSIAALKESLNQQQDRAIVAPAETVEHGQLVESITALRESLQAQGPQGRNDDLKKVIEESISKQLRGRSAPVTSSQEGATTEKLQLQINGLESMLRIAENRAEEEHQARRAAEDALAGRERELKSAVADVEQYREAAEETEKSLKSFLDEQQTAKQHTATLEEVRNSMEKTIADMSEKVSALEDTLQEYRDAHRHDKKELEENRTRVRSLDEENSNLDRSLRAVKAELEDNIKTKQALKAKWDKIQEEMANTARKITQEQASWRHKESEARARYDLQTARLEAEARTRERLETEIERLERQEKEAMKAKFLVEQIRGENKELVKLVNTTRTQNHELQEQANKHQRERHDLQESSRAEITRIMNSTKADVSAANKQVELLRSNLENVIERLEAEVDQHKLDNKNLKQRYEALLEEASKSRDNALREAAEARDAALQEHYRFHEHTLEETKASHGRIMEEINGSHERAIAELKATHQRVLENVTKDHQRAMNIAVERHERDLDAAVKEHGLALKAATDAKQTIEAQLSGRVALADETIAHLRDHVAHVEERLELAKSAAQAAAEAAKAARASNPKKSPTSPRSTRRASIARPSMPVAEESGLPEKISPQALRESIMVLQDQLHQRESQIEKLEEELAKVDKEAPNKIKERDIEITWLRELLGVRLDDLQDVIQQLSQQDFDRNAVRDAVIRLKANVQMEQQEKERAMAGGGPRLPSLSTITASPRAIPMAAAAAWGNWRKAQSSLGSLAEMAAPIASGRNAEQPTPARSSSPQSFLSGLLTPPSTSARHVSQPTTPTHRSSGAARRPLGAYSTPQKPRASSSASMSAPRRTSSGASAPAPRRPLAQVPRPPRTPPAQPPISLQADDYDADAPSEDTYSLSAYMQDEEAVEEVGEEGAERASPTQKLHHAGDDGAATPPVLMGEGVELSAELPDVAEGNSD